MLISSSGLTHLLTVTSSWAQACGSDRDSKQLSIEGAKWTQELELPGTHLGCMLTCRHPKKTPLPNYPPSQFETRDYGVLAFGPLVVQSSLTAHAWVPEAGISIMT